MLQSSPSLFISNAYSFICRNQLWLSDGKRFVVKELPTKCDQLQVIYKQMRPTAKIISIKKAIARLGFRRKESKEGEIIYFHDPEFYLWKCPWTFSRSHPPDMDLVCPKPRQEEYLKKKKTTSPSSHVKREARLSELSETSILALIDQARLPSSECSNTSSPFYEIPFHFDRQIVVSPGLSSTNVERSSNDEEAFFLNREPAGHQQNPQSRFDNSSPGSLAVAAATAVAMSQPKLPPNFLNNTFQFQVPLAPQHQALSQLHYAPSVSNQLPLPSFPFNLSDGSVMGHQIFPSLTPTNNTCAGNFNNASLLPFPEQPTISVIDDDNICSMNQSSLIPSFYPSDNTYNIPTNHFLFGQPQCDDQLSRFLSDLEHSISPLSFN